MRFYESEGLLAAPARTAAGYRTYPDDTISRVRFIKQAQSAGLRLSQIRDILAIRDRGQAPCGHVARLVTDRLEDVTRRLAELEHTRAELLALDERLAALDPADCHDDDICAAITTDRAAGAGPTG